MSQDWVSLPFSVRLTEDDLNKIRRGFPKRSGEKWGCACSASRIDLIRLSRQTTVYRLPVQKIDGVYELGPLKVVNDTKIYRRSSDPEDVERVADLLNRLMRKRRRKIRRTSDRSIITVSPFSASRFTDPQGREIRAFLLSEYIWYFRFSDWMESDAGTRIEKLKYQMFNEPIEGCIVTSKHEAKRILEFITEVPVPPVGAKTWAFETFGEEKAMKLRPEERAALWMNFHYLDNVFKTESG